jgi:hypothetical protein
MERVSPLAPSNISVNSGNTIVAPGKFTVSWSNSPGNVNFHYDYSYDSGANWYGEYVSGSLTSIEDKIYNSSAQKVRYSVWAEDEYCRSINTTYSADVPVVWNSAPNIPESISLNPANPNTGQKITISWGLSTDQNGNLEGYMLERSTDGGVSWTQIYEGLPPQRLYTEPISSAWQSVRYRVRAFDTFGLVSQWRETATIVVILPTVISVQVNENSSIKIGDIVTEDEDISLIFSLSNNKDEDMTGIYTAVLLLDGKELARQTGNLGANWQFLMQKSDWQRILNGTHQFIFTLFDTKNNAGICTVTFTKKVTKLIFQTKPLFVDIPEGIIRKYLVNFQAAFANESTYHLQFTNNAKDDNPEWHDVLPVEWNTDNFYTFENETVKNGNWFAARFFGERTGEESCHVDLLSGIAGLSYVISLGGESSALREDLTTEISRAMTVESTVSDNLTTEITRATTAESTILSEIAELRNTTLLYKGEVDTFSDLPAGANDWELYKVAQTGEEYYSLGGTWNHLDFTVEEMTAQDVLDILDAE